MSADEREPPPHSARGMVGFLSTNAAVVGAVMFYMGWAYTDAWLGHFNVRALDVDIGFTEYVLRGLHIFSPAVIAFGAGVLLAMNAGLVRAPGRADRNALRRIGVVATAAGVLGYLVAGSVSVPTYPVLALLGAGPLMLAWSARGSADGRYAYSLALIITTLCGLWMASLYASARGAEAGRQTARELQSRTAAVVYSARPLALAGPGVQVERLPKGAVFGYRYSGLRVLIARGDRYYLLPVEWTDKISATYVLHEGDDLRVELYSGTR
ncbi:hypothetical protein AB0L00_36680 [Actinoallomurus sp. NPDC052308]|uniref:hypothetical protein n=1 Tax=Actinoallomurus sp. NPDC052308 TaxID=3155530 RepID=UPI003417176E